MSGEFTLAAYARLLDAVTSTGYDCLTVREYLAADSLPERFVILRHDVDRKPRNAERMAALEAEYGVSASYYLHSGVFREDTAERLESLGHEVGYHYDDFVAANGTRAAAHSRFSNSIRVFRRACSVDTVSAHVSPLSRYDNADIWCGYDALSYGDHDLLGDADRSVDFVDVAFFSDAGRTWQDGPATATRSLGERDPPFAARSTSMLASHLRNRDARRLCIVTHPSRWADSLPELVAARSKDRAANLVRRSANLLDYGAAES